jgi:hypothetical protein
MDVCCELRRQLAERFATAARLYAETVVLFTRYPTNSQHDYNRLLAATEKAQERSEAAAVAFEEHVASHQCATTERADGDSGQFQSETA